MATLIQTLMNGNVMNNFNAMKRLFTPEERALELINSGVFPSINRKPMTTYDMETELKLVQRLGESRISNFVIDENNRFAYEQTIKWVLGDTTMQALNPDVRKADIIAGNVNAGLFVGGDTGTGKTLLLEIMAIYAQVYDINFYYGNNKEDYYKLCWTTSNFRADEICEEFSRKGNITRFAQMPILAIQDLGSEPEETVYMGNRINVLRQILEQRGDHKDKLTLITSNRPISSKELLDKYGKRVISRLNEMCNFLIMKGTDRRIAH